MVNERGQKRCHNHSKSSLDRDFEYTNDINEAISLINCENLLAKKINEIKMLKFILFECNDKM